MSRVEGRGTGSTGAIDQRSPSESGLDSRPGWIVACASAFCLVFGPSAILVAGFGVFVAPLSQEFGWSGGQIGLAVSLMALALVGVSPLQGVLIDRQGCRRVILWSIPAFSAGLVLMSQLSGSLIHYYVAWSLLALWGVGLWPASYLKVTSTWFEGNLGLGLGVANAGVGLGIIVVPPIASALVAAWGWRVAFMGLAGLSLLSLPVTLLWVHERPGSHGTPATPVQLRVALPADARSYLAILIAYFFLGIAGTGLVANLLPSLVAGGMAPGRAVAVMSLFGITALLGRILTGWLLDRYFVAHVIISIVSLAAVVTGCLASGMGGVAAMVATPLLGLLTGAEFDVLAFAIRRYFEFPAFGRIYGMVFAVFQLGAAAGAALLAATVHRMHSYRPGMWLFTAAMALSIPAFAALRSYPSEPTRAPTAE